MVETHALLCKFDGEIKDFDRRVDLHHKARL